MVKALFDTNILIDYLNGIAQAQLELDRAESPMISIITWMEVMAGALPAEESDIREWLKTFDIVEIDAPVAALAVRIRKERRITLPDAIIWATARVHDALLVSRNLKDFPASEPDVRVPYTL